MKQQLILYVVAVAIVLNIVLPFIATPFATPEEITPPQGAANLSFKSQLMHMLVHHAQVPLTSSLIVAVIAYLSMYIAHQVL